MRVLLGVLVGVVAVGCGLSLTIDDVVTAPPDAATTEPTTTTPPKPTTTAPIEPDAAPTADAEADASTDATVDAPDTSVVRTVANVKTAYALGKNGTMYLFDVPTRKFTAQVSTGCPPGEETAVMENGTVYATADDSRALYRWAAGVGCTKIKDNTTYPIAIGTAVIAGVEELVGYRDGNYEKIDTTTGNVSRITSGALGALRPAGDVTRIGNRMFLSVLGGGAECGAGGNCITEVTPADGKPTGPLTQFGGQGLFGLAHAEGKLLFFSNDAVYQLGIGTSTLPAPLAAFPDGGGFTGAGSAAVGPP